MPQCWSDEQHFSYSKLKLKSTGQESVIITTVCWIQSQLNTLHHLIKYLWMFLLPLAERKEGEERKTSTHIYSLSALGKPAPREDPASARSCLSEFIYNSQNTGVTFKTLFKHFILVLSSDKLLATLFPSLHTLLSVFGIPVLKLGFPQKNTSTFHVYKVNFIFKIIQLFLIAPFKVQTSAYLQHSFDKTCTNVYLSFNIQVRLKTQLVRDLRFIDICPFLDTLYTNFFLFYGFKTIVHLWGSLVVCALVLWRLTGDGVGVTSSSSVLTLL